MGFALAGKVKIGRFKYAKQCITQNICEILWNFTGFKLLCLHIELGGSLGLGFVRILLLF